MVRSIVGTLVDVGLGKASPGDVRGILVARDREAAGQVAPPYGLVLWEVGYAAGPVRSGSRA
jgi:tRNA pseudouridine38-40 synthase